jgi:hypothetical protein
MTFLNYTQNSADEQHPSDIQVLTGYFKASAFIIA